VKWLSLTVAYAALGNVATKPDQAGPYLSVHGSF